MCDAIRGMIENGRMEGIKEGIRALVEVCQDFGASKAETASKIMTKFSISQEEAELDTDKYWRS